MLTSEMPPRRLSPICQPGYRLGMAPPNAGHSYPAEVLTVEEVHAILKAFGRGYAGARDRALTVLLWRTGLRIAEALALYPKDVDLQAHTVTVLHGKGDRSRKVGLDPDGAVYVEQWLERRRELGLTGREPLFCVISKPTLGKPLYSSCYRDALRDAAARAGIEKRVHPHGLRHTHASHLAEQNVPIHIIKAQLGHSSLATTDRYINHLSPRQVVDAVAAAFADVPVA